MNRAAALALALFATTSAAQAAPSDSSFGRLVESLSEPGGYFDSDNIITNEMSYLKVLDILRAHHVQGGAYVGVGPDQNFSYIVATRPSIAFVVDIRRDNLLEHLLFKALFASSRNRIEYLSLLIGKPLPSGASSWNDKPLSAIIAKLDHESADSASVQRARRIIADRVTHFGLVLSAQDLATIDRYRTQFVDGGLDVRFSSLGRNNAFQYPTLRLLLLETDASGQQASYMATEDAFALVRRMEEENRIVPLVANLASNGPKGLRALGSYLKAQHEHVSVLYTSNVEQYLFRDGSFDQFARNAEDLPRDTTSVVIRSYFGRFGGHPMALPGYNSVSLVQPLDAFVRAFDAGQLRSYADIIDRGYLERQ